MRDVDHVQQQVGFGDFFERGLEGRYQGGGQFLDETDRVGHQRLVTAGQFHAAGGGVERGEELVGGVHVRAGQAVQQRRLACVGVADQSHGGNARTLALGAIAHAVGADLFQLAFEVGDACADGAAVDFQLRFARAAQADSAGRAGASAAAACLAGQVRPLTGKARQEILVLRQFHLQHALAGVRMLGENVENQGGTVEDADLLAERLFQFALVART